MHILEKYTDGINQKDADAIGALFTPDCRFSDAGGRPFGHPDIELKGSDAVRDLFKGIFKDTDVTATIRKLYPASMAYDVEFAGTLMPCIGTATLKDGRIDEYMVRPR